jgi:hypothetical protein
MNQVVSISAQLALLPAVNAVFCAIVRLTRDTGPYGVVSRGNRQGLSQRTGGAAPTTRFKRETEGCKAAGLLRQIHVQLQWVYFLCFINDTRKREFKLIEIGFFYKFYSRSLNQN